MVIDRHNILRTAVQWEQLSEPLAYRNFIAQARYGISREAYDAFFRKMLADVYEPTAPYGLMDVQCDGSRLAEAPLSLDSALCRRCPPAPFPFVVPGRTPLFSLFTMCRARFSMLRSWHVTWIVTIHTPIEKPNFIYLGGISAKMILIIAAYEMLES